MKLKIWERYLLKEVIKLVTLFSCCFFFLYVLIDFSSQVGRFTSGGYTWLELVSYYGYTFVRRLDLILPFGILIASVRTLCSLNTYNELVAMMASGISLKRLLRPFLLVGLLGTVILYISSETLLPTAMEKIERMEYAHLEEEKVADKSMQVKELVLSDESKILYQSYDLSRELFFDAYWIRSIDNIYHMKYLFPDADYTVGRYVDHLVRNPKTGRLEKKESVGMQVFREIQFDSEALKQNVIPPENQRISKLWAQLPGQFTNLTDREADVATAFYFKLTMPWLCLLTVIGPAPFCLTFTRQFSQFLVYLPSVFGLIAFYLVMDAAYVMGESQVLPPILAIGVPAALIYAPFSYRFLAIR